MTMLPDVDEDGWNNYQQQSFQETNTRRIAALEFQHRTMARIQELNAMAAPPRLGETTIMPGGPGMPIPQIPAPQMPQIPMPQFPQFPTPAPQPAPGPILPQAPSPFPSPITSQPQIPEAPAPPIAPPGVSRPLGEPTPVPNASQLRPTPFPSIERLRLGAGGPDTTTRPTWAEPQAAPAAGGDLHAYARAAAQRNGIDPDLFEAQIQQESGFNPKAGSPAGAQGIAQIMPNYHPGVDTSDPYASLDYAAQLDATNLKKYGSTDLMLAAYNAGSGAVDKYGGVPPYQETQEYVRRINAAAPSANAPTNAPQQASTAGGFLPNDLGQQFPLAVAPNNQPNQTYHSKGGSDLMAPRGTPVLSMQDGVVTEVFTDNGSHQAGGNAVLVHGADGLDYYYAHFDAPPGVKVGDRVGGGQQLGAVGNSGNAWKDGQGETHLHIGIGHGISNGVGSEGGLGENFDAQGLLKQLGGLINTKPAPAHQPIQIGQQVGQSATSSAPTFTSEDLDTQRQLYTRAFSAINPNLPSAPSARAGEQAFAPSTAAASANPLDNLGSLIGNAIQSALSSVLGGGGPPGDRSRDTLAQRAGQQATSEDLSLQPWQHQLDLKNPVTGESIQRELGLPDLTPPRSINEAIDRATQDALRRGLPSPGPTGQLGILDPKLGNPAENPEDIFGISDLLDRLARGGQGAERAAQALSDAFTAGRVGSRASSVIDAAGRSIPRRLPGEPLGSLLPSNTFERLGDSTTARGALGRFIDRMTFEFTDRNMSLNQLQASAQEELGRPLRPDEMVGFLNRLSPGGASHIAVDQGLGPVVREVGQHYNSFLDYLTARSNVSTAEEIGRQATARGVDEPIASALTANVKDAEARLATRQATLERLVTASTSSTGMPGEVGTPTQQEINAAARAVDRAETTLARHQDVADAAQQAITQQASTMGADVAKNRLFAGGLTRDTSQELLNQLEQQLPPEVWDLFHSKGGAGDRFFEFGTKLRDRLTEAGVMSPDEAEQLAQQYPDWFRRHALDYMADNTSRGLPSGQRLGLNDRSLRQYTLEGSAQSIQNPVEGMISYADQVERMARKNEAANALLRIDGQVAEPQMRQRISPGEYSSLEKKGQDMSRYTTTVGPGEKTMNVFRDGEKQEWVTSNPYYTQAIEGAQASNLPNWARNPANFVRMVATARNPAFLAGNALLDVPAYTLRTAAQGGAGGILQLPQILAELVRGYADSFSGITSGRFEGSATQRFLSQGGGMSGEYRAFEPEAAAKRVEELRRSHVWDVSSPADLKRIIGGLVKMRAVESIGQRIELGPRVAAMRMAERRGWDPVRATLAGRDVTVDFDRGGRMIKFLNQFMPFLNAGFQGSAQLGRMIRENPAGSATALSGLVGLPAIGAEAWNRSDPQRAKDYADVPDYIKNQGIVLMLPTKAPLDDKGNRRPQYVHINLREFAPAAIVAREAASRIAGDDPKSWQELAGTLAQSVSPVQASNLGDLASRFQALPAAGTLYQLNNNKDAFRGSTIVSEAADKNASPLAKAVTPWLQRGIEAWDRNTSAEIRPSAIDFAIRDTAGSWGNMALGASRLGQPHDDQPQNMPILGAFASRALGGNTGAKLDEARGQVLTPSARQALRSQGIQWTPTPVGNVAQKVPLRQTEQTRLQELTNRYTDDAIQKLVRKDSFVSAKPEKKDRELQLHVNQARTKAQLEVLRAIPQAERRARTKSGSSKD